MLETLRPASLNALKGALRNAVASALGTRGNPGVKTVTSTTEMLFEDNGQVLHFTVTVELNEKRELRIVSELNNESDTAKPSEALEQQLMQEFCSALGSDRRFRLAFIVAKGSVIEALPVSYEIV